MIDSRGRLFGRFNVLDALLVVVLALGMLGVGLARAGKAGVNKQLRGTVTAEFDLYFRGGVADPSIFKVGDKTFITIRNQPYAALAIRKVKVAPRAITITTPSGAVKAVPDPSEPFSKDIVLTLREHGELTDDGIVMGGNKIKVGLPIEIEGFKYRIKGAIVDVRVVPEPKL